MSVLVAQQDESIDYIQNTAHDIEQDASKGCVTFTNHSYALLTSSPQGRAHGQGGRVCSSCPQKAMDLLRSFRPLAGHRCCYRRRCCGHQQQQEVIFIGRHFFDTACASYSTTIYVFHFPPCSWPFTSTRPDLKDILIMSHIPLLFLPSYLLLTLRSVAVIFGHGATLFDGTNPYVVSCSMPHASVALIVGTVGEFHTSCWALLYPGTNLAPGWIFRQAIFTSSGFHIQANS